MTSENILNIELKSMDFDKPMTIKAYLKLLLIELFEENECFSGKRPFGNSGWECDVYDALVENKIVADRTAAHQKILDLIRTL